MIEHHHSEMSFYCLKTGKYINHLRTELFRKNKLNHFTFKTPTYVVQTYLLINTLRPRQNGRHFTDDIFKCIFLYENAWIPIWISLNVVPKGPINNIPALVQHWFADQATSHYLNQWWLDHRRIYASLGLNELRSIMGIILNRMSVNSFS